MDTAKITGESVPADVAPGDRVLSGCINISGVLTIRAESEYASSTVARILELMESATEGQICHRKPHHPVCPVLHPLRGGGSCGAGAAAAFL